MCGYGGGGGHYSKYTQQVSFREPGQTDGRPDNVKTVYPPTNTVCGGIIYSVGEKTAYLSAVVYLYLCGFCAESLLLPLSTLDWATLFYRGTPWAFHIIP